MISDRVAMAATVYNILLYLTLTWVKVSSRSASSNDILGLAIPTEPNLDPNTVCKTFPDLTPAQYDLCRRLPDVTASAIQGIQISVHECQHQFKQHRWNCSALEKKNKNPHSSPMLSQGKGFRETAFAYAVSAAGVTTQVARACSLGKLASCGCQGTLDMSTNTWKWKGCNHNVDYGNDFARKFLDSKENAKDLLSQINLHNNRAGRLAVKRNTRKMCKCHGMSGSCEMKTCWRAAPPFRQVGTHLKDKYQHATKVDNTNSARGRLKPVKRKRRRPHRTDLVFFERSPSFCDPIPEVDALGTRGRYCNKSSTGIDNCETLCCGRGYNTLKVTRTERCHCRFHWCCYVICKKCTFNDWVTVCK